MNRHPALVQWLAVAALSVPNFAAARARMATSVPTPFKTVYTLSGSCSTLSAPTADYTKSCAGTLFRIIYPDGRESYAFGVEGKALISFSGFAAADSPGSSIVKIDHLTVTYGPKAAPKVEPHDATGFCSLTIPNFPNGDRFGVKCIAQSRDGPYRGSFISDGTPATRTDF